jgi:hypothetical protein
VVFGRKNKQVASQREEEERERRKEREIEYFR